MPLLNGLSLVIKQNFIHIKQSSNIFCLQKDSFKMENYFLSEENLMQWLPWEIVAAGDGHVDQ